MFAACVFAFIAWRSDFGRGEWWAGEFGECVEERMGGEETVSVRAPLLRSWL